MGNRLIVGQFLLPAEAQSYRANETLPNCPPEIKGKSDHRLKAEILRLVVVCFVWLLSSWKLLIVCLRWICCFVGNLSARSR